jgi:hypothetical protein
MRVSWQFSKPKCVDVIFNIPKFFDMKLEVWLTDHRQTCASLKKRVRAVRCDERELRMRADLAHPANTPTALFNRLLHFALRLTFAYKTGRS